MAIDKFLNQDKPSVYTPASARDANGKNHDHLNPSEVQCSKSIYFREQADPVETGNTSAAAIWNFIGNKMEFSTSFIWNGQL